MQKPSRSLLGFFFAAVMSPTALSTPVAPVPQVARVAELKRLSLEELLEVQVVTPARYAEPLYRSAAAIYVLSADEIRRSGVRTIPDALRLVPGMQVAQQNGRTWAISPR